MSVALQRIEVGPDESVEAASYPDYIVAKLKLDGRSQRWLAEQTGICRSRMQRLLCGDPRQRKPLRLEEAKAIFATLGVDDYVVALATELMAVTGEADFAATEAIASMLSAVFRGLAGRVATAIRHIDGLEHHDIRPEYGTVMREAVVRTIQNNFTEIAARRSLRLDQLLSSDRAGR